MFLKKTPEESDGFIIPYENREVLSFLGGFNPGYFSRFCYFSPVLSGMSRTVTPWFIGGLGHSWAEQWHSWQTVINDRNGHILLSLPDYRRVWAEAGRNILYFLDISGRKEAYSAPLTLRFSQKERKRRNIHRWAGINSSARKCEV